MNAKPLDKPNYPDNMDGRRLYFNLYTSTRHYGGAEEGGWWYDIDKCELSIPVRAISQEIDAIFEYLKEYVVENELKWGNIGHSTGGQDAWCAIQERPAQSECLERPDYE